MSIQITVPELSFICSACGGMMTVSSDIVIEINQSVSIDCPYCNAPHVIAQSIQVLGIQQLKTNYKTLLESVRTEIEIDDEIKALEAEIADERAGGEGKPE